jgi:hypothetical protein
MRESLGVKTHRRNDSKSSFGGLTCECLGFGFGLQHGPVSVACGGAETERMR